MVRASFWVLVQPFDGAPKITDFRLDEEELPPVGEGEYLAEAVAWSVDPYQRAYVTPETLMPYRMFGYQVAKVTESRHPRVKVGSHVVSHVGWRSHTVLNDKGAVGFDANMDSGPYTVSPLLAHLPISYMLGVLGMPGMTAYFGVRETLQPKSGEVLVVNAAAGAVGSCVGQIGKIHGCMVIGYAGSDAKVAWLKELGFDHAFNYKTTDVDETLKAAAPEGVDMFFDNVGGDFASRVYAHLAVDARICQCGAISGYNEKEKPLIPDFRAMMIFKRATLSGFHVAKFGAQFPVGIREMATYITKGKLKSRETTWKGLTEIPSAFMQMLNGANIGKSIVQALHV